MNRGVGPAVAGVVTPRRFAFAKRCGSSCQIKFQSGLGGRGEIWRVIVGLRLCFAKTFSKNEPPKGFESLGE